MISIAEGLFIFPFSNYLDQPRYTLALYSFLQSWEGHDCSRFDDYFCEVNSDLTCSLTQQSLQYASP